MADEEQKPPDESELLLDELEREVIRGKAQDELTDDENYDLADLEDSYVN